MLRAVALIHIFVKDNPHYGSFLLVDVQFVQFMLALVDTPTPYKVIAIRRISALEVTFFYKLAQTGAGTDGSLFAFSVRLPESDVVQQFVSVVVETLLTLLGTPYPDAVPYKPFHNKGRFICDTTDTVEHEYQQDIELALSGIVLDDLELVAGGGPDFVAGHAFFLFFMDDDPALRFSEFMASLSLHGQVCFMVGVEIHLLIGGNAVQAAHAIVISCHCKFLTFIIKVGILLYVLLSFVTFSVYHFYFMDLWAKDVNILCEKDGKHTVGVEKMMLFSVLTFGVYKYVWLAEIVDRICDNAAEYDVEVRQDSETFFVWMILVPVLGYLVAMYRAIRDTNRLAEAYERSRQKRTEVHDNPNTKPPPPCMRGRLSGLTGSLAGRSFELIPGRSVELGRNPAEVSLIVRGEKISRIHCTVQYNGKDLGFNVTDHSRNGVFVNGVRIPYNVPTYVSGKSIVALADGANKFQLIEAADEDDRSPALGADNEE